MLRELPAWATANPVDEDGEVSLPTELAVHLEVPDVVTERTRALAAELVAGRATAYDRALAIEQYLRQYAYDLEVPEPPDDVTEIADYFLFELQRGYCDYYATAFVVLARLAGLPTRFATGYSYGQWNPVDGVFVISEGDAHSWPEVYFPEAGWIPFEPTAARSQLTRTALPVSSVASQAAPPALPAPAEQEELGWSWQLAIWLLPLVAVVLLVMRGVAWWWRRREDPWQAVLQWGRGVGRPIDEGETVLEYGQGLAGYVISHQRSSQDAGRVAAREIQALSEEVNRLRYAPTNERELAKTSLDAHWQRLRTYLRLVRIR
jgi:transglutaminase-like putative cysteine protease